MSEGKKSSELSVSFPPISRQLLEEITNSEETSLNIIDEAADFLAKHDALSSFFLDVYGASDEAMGTAMYWGAGIVGALLRTTGFKDREISIDLISGTMESWREENWKDFHAILALLDADPNLLAAATAMAFQNSLVMNPAHMIYGGGVLIECYKSILQNEQLGEEISGLDNI